MADAEPKPDAQPKLVMHPDAQTKPGAQPKEGWGPVSTDGPDPVIVLMLPAYRGGTNYRHAFISNEGDKGGFFSLNGGKTWRRIAANSSRTVDINIAHSVQIKRGADGDLSDVYGDIH